MVEKELSRAMRVLEVVYKQGSDPKAVRLLVIDADTEPMCMLLLHRRLGVPAKTKVVEFEESFIRVELYAEAHVYAKEFGIQCGCNEDEYIFV